MWQPINDEVLREVFDFGVTKLASVSVSVGDNRWLVLSEPITHTDPERIDWQRMIGEMYAGGEVMEAQ